MLYVGKKGDVAVVQPVKARAREVKTAEQVDAAGRGFRQRALRFRYLEQGEGGATAIETFTNQPDRSFEARKNLGIEPFDFMPIRSKHFS